MFPLKGVSGSSKLTCALEQVNQSEVGERLAVEAAAETAKRRFREIYGAEGADDLANDMGGRSFEHLTELERERLSRVTLAGEAVIDRMLQEGASLEEIAAVIPEILQTKGHTHPRVAERMGREEAAAGASVSSRVRRDLDSQRNSQAVRWRNLLSLGRRSASIPDGSDIISTGVVQRFSMGTSRIIPELHDITVEGYEAIFGKAAPGNTPRVVLRAIDSPGSTLRSPRFPEDLMQEPVRQLQESALAEAMGISGVPISRLVKVRDRLYVATEHVEGHEAQGFFRAFPEGRMDFEVVPTESGRGQFVSTESFNEQVAFRFLMKDPDGHSDNFRIVPQGEGRGASLVGFDTGAPHDTHPRERGRIGTFLPDIYPRRVLEFLGPDTPTGEGEFLGRIRTLFEERGLPVIEGELREYAFQRRVMLQDYKRRFPFRSRQ